MERHPLVMQIPLSEETLEAARQWDAEHAFIPKYLAQGKAAMQRNLQQCIDKGCESAK